MTEAAVVKKRGRPRKADVASSSIDSVAAPIPAKETAKTSKSTRKTTTTKPASTKKTATRKPTDSNKTVPDAPEVVPTPPLIAQPTRRKAPTTTKTKPSIPEQATAFHTLQPSKSENPSQFVDKPSSGSYTDRISEQSTATSATVSSAKSQSFSLSSFLDESYKEPTPEPSEASLFTDRSAFGKYSIPAIEEIIRGDGVTSLASLSRTEQTTTRDRFKPVSPPARNPTKTFQGYGLRAFPDKAQSRTAKSERLNIPPETYGSQSFSALKTPVSSHSIPPSETSHPAAMPLNNPTSVTISATSQKAFSTTSEAAARSRTSQSSTQPRFPVRDMHQSQATAPIPSAEATSPPTTASRIQNLFIPVTKPPTPDTPSQPPTTTGTQAKISNPRTSPSTLQPPKPTQMTPQQLLRNPAFKSKRRQYLGLIVGIPVVLATSIEVYRRFGGASFITDEPGVLRVEGVRTRRGELPQGGLLGDGGLKREGQD